MTPPRTSPRRSPLQGCRTPSLGADEDEGRFTYERAGFEVAVDLTTVADGRPLSDGLWDISLAIGVQGLSRELRLGSKRASDVSGNASTRVMDLTGELRAATLYATKPHGNFTLDVGEQKYDVLPHLSVTAVRWASDEPTELEFNGRCTLAAYPDAALAVTLTDEQGDIAAFSARRPSESADFTVRVPVSELPSGVWSGELRLGRWSLPLPELPQDLAPAKWRRRGLPWYAKPMSHDAETFALQVARTDLVKAVTRRVKS